MAVSDCLYTLEDYPDLLEMFKRDLIETGRTDVPRYISRLIEETKSERMGIQLAAIKLQNALSYIESYVARAPNKRAYNRAVNNLVGADYKVGKTAAGYTSLEMRAEAINAHYQRQIADFMEQHRPRKFGFDQSPKANEEFVRAMFGDTTDIDAKSYAKIVSDALEDVRIRHAKAGGNIQKLETYRMPQPSDPIKVGLVSKKEYITFTKPLLSQNELHRQAKSILGVSRSTPLTDKQIDTALGAVYDNIRTRGAASVVPGKHYGGMRKAVSKRRQDHRFLHFKDAESWINYNRRFGEGTAYSAVTSHIDRMARDIAAMEILGPNPERALEYLIDHAKRQTGDPRAGVEAREIYKTVMGEFDGVPNPKWASRMRDMRNVMAATKLPMATLSAISDNFFLGRTAVLNGIPMVKVYKRFFKNLMTGGLEDKLLAGKVGLTMEYALDKVAAFSRISMTTGNNWTSRWVDFALRANGLNHWTNTIEATFGLEFMSLIAENVGKEYGALGTLKKAFQRYGITEADWGVIRRSNLTDYNGLKYLNAGNIEDLDVMAKVQGMVINETRLAAPRPTAKVRAKMYGTKAAGTFEHELRHTLFQFKGFPVSIMMSQWARELSHNSGWSKVAGLGSLLLGTTILGAFAYNAKEIAKGRTPIDMDAPEFWANGFVQGGGLGLLGDALFLDPNKQGSVTQFLAGPLVGEADKLIKNFVLLPARDLVEQEDKFLDHLTTNAIRAGESYLPTPLNLPVVKTAIQRALFDQMHKAANPNWHSNRRRIERELRQTRGQDYWWRPGDAAPRFK